MLSLLALCVLQPPKVILFDMGFYVGDYHDGAWHEAPKKPDGIQVPIDVTGFGVGTIGKAASIKSLIHEDLSEGIVVGENEPRELYVSGRKPTFPLAVTTLPNDSAPYLAIVKKYLVSKGLAKAAPKVRQLFKVDLDGDGRDEVLINASNCTDEDLSSAISGAPRNKGGDYSGLLLRYVDRKGVAHTKELDWASKRKAEEMLTEFKFDGLADLDGDGKFEIVKSYLYYEGGGVALLRYAKGSVRVLLSVGGGA